MGAPEVMSSSAGIGSVSNASKYGPPGSSFSGAVAAIAAWVPSSAAAAAASQPSGGGMQGMLRAPARFGGVSGAAAACASASACAACASALGA